MRPLKKPDAILFDWDGTLVDSLAALRTYYNHVLGVFEKPSITMEEAKQNIRKSAREVFPELFGDKSEEAFNVYYDFVEKNHIDHLSPFEGSHSFLEVLAAHKIPMGIVSNKRHSFLLKEIDHLGWDKYLIQNVGAGQAEKDKPAPDSLLLAAEKMGFSSDKNEIWYVGDTETDMMAAIAAGFQPIFIEHGLGTREDCTKNGIQPHFIKNLPELIALVEKYY